MVESWFHWGLCSVWKKTFFVFLDSCNLQDALGDGKCNKKANTDKCNFDGGDCCSLCKTITVSVNVESLG